MPKPSLPRRSKTASEPAPPAPKYTVIRDTREHDGKGWVFSSSTSCDGTVVKKLDTGDYSLLGFEEVITIDRKGSIGEFAKNVCELRFERELERMSTFKYAAVFLEFDWSDMWRWPQNSGIPKSRQVFMRFNRHAFVKKFWELKLKYPYVDFQFVGDHGKDAVSSLFKRVFEQHGKVKAA